VSLRVHGATATLLERHRSDLPMLFIVSQLDLVTGVTEGPPLEVTVTRAQGEKCARCWRIVSSVSTEPGTEGLCDRCVDALATAAGPVAG
jgi:isoleucyl-tRNA synthetase